VYISFSTWCIKQRVALIAFIALLCFATSVNAQFYYGLQTEFGKNRIKYEDFFWTHYSYPVYDVYFYEEGKDLANYVSKEAQKQIQSVEKFFDYPLEDRLQFIVFNKHSDFKQSNIGFSSDDSYNIGGVTRIVGTKVILYYEGDHDKLDAQIRAGVAEVLVNQMLYGGSVGQMVRNNSTLVLPDWYIKGLISYMANDWNTDIDNKVRDAVMKGKYKKINSLEGIDAVYAGNAFWKHIANNYGETVIPNILYMTKVTHNVDNSTTYVLGLPMRSLWEECLETFTQRYTESDTTKKIPVRKPVLKRTKASRVYSQMKVSNDGTNIVYTTNEMGQYKVWLYNVNTKKSKRIYKAEHKIDRINDYSYPIVAWHPDNKHFSFIIERKGILVMKTYDLETWLFQERNITGFEKILDFSYNDDGKKFVMSAVQKGQTDIYIFTAASNAYYQITKDIYDDMQPRFINNSKGVVFVSNRPEDSIKFDNKRKWPERQTNTDIFIFNNVTKSPALIRVTNTPFVNESRPSDFDESHITYLSDANGIHNRYLAHLDSTIAFVDTTMHYRTVVNAYPISNYSRSIIEQDINVKAQKYTEIIYLKGKYRLFSDTLKAAKELTPVELKNTSYRDYKNSMEKIKQEKQFKDQLKKAEIAAAKYQIEVVQTQNSTNDSSEININNYTFEGEEKKINNIVSTQIFLADTNKATKSDFELGKQKNYYTNFTLDYVVSQLDNTFLNGTYQKYSGGTSPVYLNPGLNALFKVSISDLFEDYRMVGGARFSTDLSNNEYFFSHEDRMKNIDKQLVLHRQRMMSPVDGGVKILVHDARYTLKRPFSEVSCIRGSVTYRNNRMIFMGVNDNYLASRDMFENWGSTLIEYVFDNSIKKGLNLYNGVRAKIFGEYYKQLDKKDVDFFVAGFDFRHYQKIHRNFIWANRFAASTSIGNQKLIYYMGGVDNWFTPKFDYTTNISTTQNYAYQTLATNMRGFYQNARNGNSFAVINSELRLPIFSYLFQSKLHSDFIQNFQVVGFGDVGSAWIGETPYSNNEPYKTTITGSAQSPVIVYVYNKHSPIIGGYGWGVRSRLWGYFVRLDRAWGVQDGIILKPITYLSLSMDF
jgi:hypothetical protein